MLRGWDDQVMFDLRVQRQMAIITGEITNRTMGGNGVVDYIMKAFPLPNDKQNEVAALTPEKITELIELYNARQAAKRKK